MPSGTISRTAQPAKVGLVVPSDLEAMAYGLLGTPEDVREEADRIQSHLHALYQMEPDMAMRVLSAYSSRLTEMGRLLFRLEVSDRTYARLRTMDVSPLLEEIDRQFKLHSRMLEARAQDLSMEGVRR